LAIELDSIDAVRALLEKGANPFAAVRKMNGNTKDKTQNTGCSAMRLALDRKSAQDEGHLVKVSMLNNESNGECIVQLLAEYEVKAKMGGDHRTMERDKSQFITTVQGAVMSCKEMIKRVVG